MSIFVSNHTFAMQHAPLSSIETLTAGLRSWNISPISIFDGSPDRASAGPPLLLPIRSPFRVA
jgi:hypothetical protein